MSDTNYISTIVKILESPKQKVVNENILFAKFRAQLASTRKTKIVYLIFWGNLARDISSYYNLNDYILIEGYVSLRNTSNLESKKQVSKKVYINVLKIYPILLSSNSLKYKS